MENKQRTANSTYKKLAVQWLNDPAHAGLCFVSSLVVAETVFVSEIANFL
jgi:hypothetical protein